MDKTLKKIWNIVSTTLVVLMVVCAVFLMGSRLMGYQVFNVISGSMAPEYMVGDLLYVKKTDVNSIQVGDPITFVLNEDLVVATHRVVRIDAENKYFYTKGDANETEDASPVHFNNVIGVPQFKIPKLGYVSDYIQNPPGMYIVIAAGVVLVLAVFLPDLMGGKKKVQMTAEAQAEVQAEVQAEAQNISDENAKLRAELEAMRAKLQEAEEKITEK